MDFEVDNTINKCSKISQPSFLFRMLLPTCSTMDWRLDGNVCAQKEDVMTLSNLKQQAIELLDFIDSSPTPWHAVQTIERMLEVWQFTRINESAHWNLQPGGRYYAVRDGSSIVLFVLGEKPLLETGFRLLGAHTDSPGLRLKPLPQLQGDGLLRLQVEIYGSPILATFTDRDLSLAGRVCYRDDNGELQSTLVNFEKPLLRLPNLAIHMNRAVNEEGLKLHKQNELAMIFGEAEQEQLPGGYFMTMLAEQAGVDIENILGWDLSVFDTQKGAVWGAGDAFISSARLDNLASCHAGLLALLDKDSLNSGNTFVCAFFDHEEIGSESKQGAGGSFLSDVLHRIQFSVGLTGAENYQVNAKSFLVSADMAHAYQPNFPHAYDNNHKVLVNRGPVIKTNANQRYSSESISEGYFIEWCRQAGVPYQRYSHRCDLPCGSTIGPIVSAKLGIRSVDIGNPLWAMHSIRESAGVEDHAHLIKVLKAYFKSEAIRI
jgi:aspartyl aminopeptidase